VVDLTPEEHPARAKNLQSLATTHLARFLKFGNIKNLEAAVHNDREALKLIPDGHPNKAQYLESLAVALENKYQVSGLLVDLVARIHLNQEAIHLTPEGHPKRARYLQALARCFIDRYERFRQPEDIQAIHKHYSASFNTPTSTPESSWVQAMHWASFAEQFQPSHVLAAHFAAFDLLPEILWVGNSIPVRHDVIQRLCVGAVTSAGAKFCINISDLSSAVKILEQGLATTFQQMLQLKPDIHGLRSDQAKTFQKLSSQLYSEAIENPRGIAIEREKLLKDIRRQPGLENFLLPKPYDILHKASEGGPIVILNSHDGGCDGLIILHSNAEPVHVVLNSVTLDLLNSRQTMLKELLGHCNVRIRGESESSTLFGRAMHREKFTSITTDECFEDILTWLWTNIVAPVYRVLDSVRRKLLLIF
jgi:hypothetical protein